VILQIGGIEHLVRTWFSEPDQAVKKGDQVP